MADRTWLEPPRGPACGEDVAGATGSARVWLACEKSCTLAAWGGLVRVGGAAAGAWWGRVVAEQKWISRARPRETPPRRARARPPRGPAHEMYLMLLVKKRLCAKIIAHVWSSHLPSPRARPSHLHPPRRQSSATRPWSAAPASSPASCTPFCRRHSSRRPGTPPLG